MARSNKSKVTNEIRPKEFSEYQGIDFIREELASVERQIDSLNVVASFLAIRLRQLEQNEK